MKILLHFFLLAFFLCQILSATFFPHIIWTYWETGQKTLNNFNRACLIRMRQLHQNTSWSIRLVDKNTLTLWFNQSQINELNTIFKNAKISITVQNRADFYRLFLLKKYGGVWIDLSTILHQNLNWLDKLRQNPYVINRQIWQEPDMFYFYINRQSVGKTFFQYGGHKIYTVLDVQSSFMAAPKESRVIKDIIKQFTNLVLMDQEYFSIEIAQKINFPFQYKSYWALTSAIEIIQVRLDANIRRQVNQNYNIPLNNFYKIYAMSRGIGLYHQTENAQNFRKIFQNSQKGDQAKYITKIHHFTANKVVDQILRGNQFLNHKQTNFNNKTAYLLGKKYFKPNLQCLYQVRIDENSVVNNYFLYNPIIKSIFMSAYVTKQNQLPFICKITKLQELIRISNVAWIWTQNSFWIFFCIFLLIQYIFLCNDKFQIQNVCLNKEQSQKLLIKTVLIYFFINGQLSLIQSQYQLWILESPTAQYVGYAIIFIGLGAFFNIANIKERFSFYTVKFNLYIFILMSLTFEYFLQYNMASWKYEGVIYNYEYLKQINKEKLLQCELQVVKFLFLILGLKTLQLIKQFFQIQIKIKMKDSKNANLFLKDQKIQISQGF